MVYSSKNITLYCGDFFKTQKKQLSNVSGVYDRAAIIALPQPLRQQYVNHYTEILNKGVQILLIAIDYEHKEVIGPPFSVPPAEINKLFCKNFSVKVLHEATHHDLPQKLLDAGVKKINATLYRITKL